MAWGDIWKKAKGWFHWSDLVLLATVVAVLIVLLLL